MVGRKDVFKEVDLNWRNSSGTERDISLLKIYHVDPNRLEFVVDLRPIRGKFKPVYQVLFHNGHLAKKIKRVGFIGAQGNAGLFDLKRESVGSVGKDSSNPGEGALENYLSGDYVVITRDSQALATQTSPFEYLTISVTKAQTGAAK